MNVQQLLHGRESLCIRQVCSNTPGVYALGANEARSMPLVPMSGESDRNNEGGSIMDSSHWFCGLYGLTHSPPTHAICTVEEKMALMMVMVSVLQHASIIDNY